MSIQTTHKITREVAIQCILARLFQLDDDELVHVLEASDPSIFRNYWIVDEITDKDDFVIKNINDYLQ